MMIGAGRSAGMIDRAVELIKQGELVAFPTETVYGLGANAFDALACAKIFEVKRRPFFDPLIVHIATREMLFEVVQKDYFGAEAELLSEKFWPGPITFVLPKTSRIPDIVTAGLTTVAVRMPAHDVARQFLLATGCPIAAPSANPFGYLSPTSASHVQLQLGERVPFILDGGPTSVGLESTIVDLSSRPARLLRPGGITLELLRTVLPDIVCAEEVANHNQAARAAMAPGFLPSHYAPHTPLTMLTEEHRLLSKSGRFGFLGFDRMGILGADTEIFECREWASETGNLVEGAAKFFACLHRLDALGLEMIFVQPVPETGLGVAIMNRLRRAAYR